MTPKPDQNYLLDGKSLVYCISVDANQRTARIGHPMPESGVIILTSQVSFDRLVKKSSISPP